MSKPLFRSHILLKTLHEDDYPPIRGLPPNPPDPKPVSGSPRTGYGGGPWFWFVFSMESILSRALNPT
jgi:hypothetical protein